MKKQENVDNQSKEPEEMRAMGSRRGEELVYKGRSNLKNVKETSFKSYKKAIEILTFD